MAESIDLGTDNPKDPRPLNTGKAASTTQQQDHKRGRDRSRHQGRGSRMEGDNHVTVIVGGGPPWQGGGRGRRGGYHGNRGGYRKPRKTQNEAKTDKLEDPSISDNTQDNRGYRKSRKGHNEAKTDKLDDSPITQDNIEHVKDERQTMPTNNESSSVTKPKKQSRHHDSTHRHHDSTHRHHDSTHRHHESTHRPHPSGPNSKKRSVVRTLQSSELAQQLTAGTYECMVCCDKIKGRHEIWGCPCCYNLFHLKCISRWARSPAAAVSEDDHDKGWRCPGCQNSSLIIPSVYKCFCGRVNNPNERRGRGDMTVPHSCGDTCMRRLSTSVEDSCPHVCHQLCHPGPCPPCPVTISRQCPCGKTSSRVRCGHSKSLSLSCGQVCGKGLKCTRHMCTEVCHEGQCPSCVIEVEVSCFCKRNKKTIKCGEILQQGNNEVGGVSVSGYSCQRICNKLLSCGNHTCEEACHEGDCPSCVLLPSNITHCPCGATPINQLLPVGVSRTSCLDSIPTCDNECLKPHPCGDKDSIHLCHAKCHAGSCPPCTSTSYAICKCGKSSIKVSCKEVQERSGFECNRVCRKPMSCGRHKCTVKCCVSDDHECRRICGRKFSCGVHTCPDVCHPRGCGQCWNISYEELTCHCGGEVILPPIPCGTTPPVCSRPCARPHPCDHPVLHTCHNEEACPPCTYLTEKLCMGEHTFRFSIPCHLKDVSCGMPCGKPLPCDMHTCRKTCHKGPCQGDNETCTQPCTRERRYCSHPCSAPCHPGTPCPDTPCKEKVTLTCACGYNSEKTLCLASSTDVMTMAFQRLHHKDIGSLLHQLQDGQSVHVSAVSLQNLKERRLDCNEECAQFERNRRLAEALDISDPDYSPTIDGPLQYSSYLLEQARENKEFVESLEATLKQLVTNAQSSGSDSCKHIFKPMKKNHRHIIHELAPYYDCTTVSYDPEPMRNVVVMATKKSCVPSLLLSRCSNVYESSGKVRLMPPPVGMKLPLIKDSPV